MKDKQVLFPLTTKELQQKHDDLEKQYEIKKDESNFLIKPYKMLIKE